jgi:8-oxo-dGTP pyrophosphatase MutT (NUDIX family)
MVKKPDWMQPKGPEWTRLSQRLVYENPWIRITDHDATAPTGKPAQYGVVGFKSVAIAILPLHEDGSVTLIGQHRFVSGAYSWEIPEGGGPLDVDPMIAAKRELAEEAGLAGRDWRRVLDVELSNSVTDERGVGFLALDLYPAAAPPDDTELLQIARAPFREALNQALAGNMPDMLTVAMLLRAYHMAQEGELPRELTRAMLD